MLRSRFLNNAGRMALLAPDGVDGGGAAAAPSGDAAAKPSGGDAAPVTALGGAGAAATEVAATQAAASGAVDAGASVEGADDKAKKPAATTALGAAVAGDTVEGGDAAAEGEETPDAKIERLEKELADRSPPPEGKYEPFTLGDGYVMSEEQSTDFTAWANERGLSQAQAQAALDKHTAETEKNAKQWYDGVAKWKDEAARDPEIGGKNRPEALQIMGKAVGAFGNDPGLQELFETAGIGDNPALQRFFYRVGKHMGLGATPKGNDAAPAKSTGEIFYPGMKNA